MRCILFQYRLYITQTSYFGVMVMFVRNRFIDVSVSEFSMMGFVVSMMGSEQQIQVVVLFECFVSIYDGYGYDDSDFPSKPIPTS
jgi:hypothetical protein